MENPMKKTIGEIRIAEEVISAIVGLAAIDVKGVSGLAGGISNDRITTSGVKNLGKAVKISMDGESVDVRVSVVLDGAVGIPELSSEIREKVRTAVESMTGLKVTRVQVVIAGVGV